MKTQKNSLTKLVCAAAFAAVIVQLSACASTYHKDGMSGSSGSTGTKTEHPKGATPKH